MLRTALVAIACFLLAGCHTPATPSTAVESSVLLKSTASWDGTPYERYPGGQPELTILKISVPARTQLNWHSHPIPNAAYVLSGELRVRAQHTDKSILLKQGDVLAEMVDIMHRGETGDSPVELIVFYAGSPGTPLSQKSQ
jgi:quercetin dioxygenase-like cupin family protein